MTDPRSRRTVIAAYARTMFWIYAVLLFIGTHWPNLQIEGPFHRPDLVVHLFAFALWTLFALACGWFGPPTSWPNIWRTGLIATAYAGVDEALQAVPIVNRWAAWDDFFANLLGVAAALLIAVVGNRTAQARRDPQRGRTPDLR
ncbi:MAG: hypothetical protein HRU70_07770 [Phycisphaeraceae bacterium]|nr:MAG: hypothetical protein HRU70_07770 [Phycisphaeraceae bacterium]